MTSKGRRLDAYSLSDKRELLRKALEEKAKRPADRRAGFVFPSDYPGLKRQLETAGGEGVADLFYLSFDGTNTDVARRGGTTYLNFCSYNYLGMSGDPAVNQAAKEAVEIHGTSVSASRLVSGERPLHRELETELADFLGTQDAIAFVGGFSTNEDVIGHLLGKDDLVVYDSYIHASVQQGARLSGAKVIAFPHNDLDTLNRVLARQRTQYRQVLIVVEGVYSMDGDIPELPQLIEIKNRHRCLLMVDEAHSVGVLGATGRGLAEFFNVDPDDVDLWMGTLSKTFASCGGYIAGSSELVAFLRYTAPSFVYSVGITPANAAAALQSLRLLRAEPQRVRKLQANARLFQEKAKHMGLDTGASEFAATIPVMIGKSMAAAQASRFLMQAGVLALPIGYPAVPEGTARLRFFVSSRHSEEQIREGLEATAKAVRKATDQTL